MLHAPVPWPPAPLSIPRCLQGCSGPGCQPSWSRRRRRPSLGGAHAPTERKEGLFFWRTSDDFPTFVHFCQQQRMQDATTSDLDMGLEVRSPTGGVLRARKRQARQDSSRMRCTLRARRPCALPQPVHTRGTATLRCIATVRCAGLDCLTRPGHAWPHAHARARFGDAFGARRKTSRLPPTRPRRFPWV